MNFFVVCSMIYKNKNKILFYQLISIDLAIRDQTVQTKFAVSPQIRGFIFYFLEKIGDMHNYLLVTPLIRDRK